jgi:alpha-glucan phosphorylase-like protein
MTKTSKPMNNKPIWNKLVVQSVLPEKLEQLKELGMNLWWTWNDDARALFEKIDKKLFEECDYNPKVFFDRLAYKRLKEIEEDKAYLDELDAVYKRFKEYMAGKKGQKPEIAYFSMEYGLHNPLKIFSGGLGVLAGDYLKEASDSNVNIVAIGLLYRFGYFKQQISVTGEQISSNETQDFSKLPIVQVKDKAGNPLTVNIDLPGRKLIANIWKVNVGRIPLYLLDTDHKQNSQEDRDITQQLYGGDKENRLKQEILLGIGGIRALDALELKPDLYHSNEGHSAFIGLERLRKYVMDEKLTYEAAKEVVRASTLFTTHTPVPAGHDIFHEEMLKTYLEDYSGKLKISWDDFFQLGKAEDTEGDMFNMSYLAAHLSQEINAVSRLHGRVTQEMFAELWKGYLPEESHIKYVTNGVHLSTWTSPEWKALYKDQLGDDFFDKHEDHQLWEKIYDVPDKLIWETKNQHRKKLVDDLKEQYQDSWLKRHEDPKQVVKISEEFDENKLTIGFARRFATYKRAGLLFKDIERLANIVNNEEQPVQFLFAGKAHPQDKPGQALIKSIVEMSKRPEFIGKIIFLQDYDMALGEKLVQGVDIWLNTPTRPLEASGTSGQKTVMNGGMHFSVLDGWWAEGYMEKAGWALPEEIYFDEQHLQDEIDAETIYQLLENEIAPLYYDRDKDNIPTKWVSYIKNSIAKVAPCFTMRRMVNDYISLLYKPMYERTIKFVDNKYNIASEMVAWKKRVLENWDGIEVVEIDIPASETDVYSVDNEFDAKVVLNIAEMAPHDVGVEIVFTDNNGKFINRQELIQDNVEKSVVTYRALIKPVIPGTLQYGVRVFPKHEHLAYRQDFGIVKWI